MENGAISAIWFGWGVVCAGGTRVLFAALFRSRLGGGAILAAYGMWVALFMTGLVLVALSGLQLYGFDRGDPMQAAGFAILFLSPLGLPLAAGAPVVVAWDLCRAVVRSRTSA